MEKILANHIPDKWLISKICEKLMNQWQKKKTHKKTKNNMIVKWVKDVNTHFSKEYIQITSSYMKRCSTSLTIKKMQIKTMSYHLTPLRMAIIKKNTNKKYWQGCGEKGTLAHYWWEFRLVQPL